MNNKEVLKLIFHGLSNEEIEELNKSIKKKEFTHDEHIEAEDEIKEQEHPIIDFNKIVDSKEAFFSLAMRLGEDKRHERIYKRVFDKSRDLNTVVGYGWDTTLNWLNKNLYIQPEKSKQYLITAYRTVEIMYQRNRANGVDLWNDDRFKEFEKWVLQSLNALLAPSKNLLTNKINAPIIKRFCELCNNSGLDKRGDESVETFGRRICSRFNLKYPGNARKYFDPNNKPRDNDKHLKQVIELILPTLKAEERTIIDNYIKSK